MNGRKARLKHREVYRTRIRQVATLAQCYASNDDEALKLARQMWQWTDQQITQSLKSIERKGQQV